MEGGGGAQFINRNMKKDFPCTGLAAKYRIFFFSCWKTWALLHSSFVCANPRRPLYVRCVQHPSWMWWRDSWQIWREVRGGDWSFSIIAVAVGDYMMMTNRSEEEQGVRRFPISRGHLFCLARCSGQKTINGETSQSTDVYTSGDVIVVVLGRRQTGRVNCLVD